MRAKMSTQERYAALTLSEEGYSQRQITLRLGTSPSVINRLLHRHKETGCVQERHRSGRRKLASPRDIRNLLRIMKKNRQQSSTELAALWQLSSGKRVVPVQLHESYKKIIIFGV